MRESHQSEDGQQDQERWRGMVKGMVKGALKKQNLTYADLATRLRALGVDESETTIRNKVSRGTFSAIFLLQCMSALGHELLPYKPEYVFQGQLPPKLVEA